MTFAEGKKLSEIPVDEKNTTMAWVPKSQINFWCTVLDADAALRLTHYVLLIACILFLVAAMDGRCAAVRHDARSSIA